MPGDGSWTPLHEGLLDALGGAIVRGEHPPGARLAAVALAAQNGLSRSTVREVVRVLETLRLVHVRRRAGIEVLPTAQWNVYAPEVIRWRLAGPDRLRQLHELSQLRSAVEPLAARLAASDASDDARRALSDAVAEMVAHAHDADGDAYLSADTRFHRTLLAASGNPMLAALGDAVESVLAGRTRHALMPRDANPEALRLHGVVAEAVARGDAVAAAEATTRIVAEADAAVQRLGS